MKYPTIEEAKNWAKKKKLKHSAERVDEIRVMLEESLFLDCVEDVFFNPDINDYTESDILILYGLLNSGILFILDKKLEDINRTLSKLYEN